MRKLVHKLKYRIVTDENGNSVAQIYAQGKHIANCHTSTAQLIREKGDIRPYLGLIKLV